MKVAIVNCKASKQDYTCKAEDMYMKSYAFVEQRKFFETAYDEYYIFSAKYGIISPDTIIDPYDMATFLNGKSHLKSKTVGEWDSQSKIEWATQGAKDILSLSGDIDLHLTTAYYNPIKNLVDQPNIKWVQQQMNAPGVQKKYREATQMFIDGKGIDKCLNHISTKDPTKEETEKWFYHKDHSPVFGKARDVWKIHPIVDLGGLHRVSMSREKQHKGWVIDESLKNNCYLTESGRWRMKK